ncbi:MAG: sugar phosphate nucleotidyltransferase [Ignavibacteriaceae bacterium]|jgi:bifunctional UDP-N-acetylglucosamine pyrophosphorylase/glucosamine-1-phosphate N-acetyltransferase
MDNYDQIIKIVKELSSSTDKISKELAIILAAGHGKRLKSEISKMLHTILGVPTVERVYSACKEGIKDIYTIIVVGIKAEDVMKHLGKREKTSYAYQQVQNGTGHAVQIALEGMKDIPDDVIVYILPGDMGLIDAETIKQFREEFLKSKADMIVLTGLYEGKPEDNYYGRIIRAKDESRNVIQIMEHKDILALPDYKPYTVSYKGKEYFYTKEELINNNEYNSGVFAFKYGMLAAMIGNLKSNNVQSEIYLTDLISLFNQKGYTVAAASPEKNYVVMGFNTQEVLKEMNEIARKIYVGDQNHDNYF